MIITDPGPGRNTFSNAFCYVLAHSALAYRYRVPYLHNLLHVDGYYSQYNYPRLKYRYYLKSIVFFIVVRYR
jgi:hypothetical protein